MKIRKRILAVITASVFVSAALTVFFVSPDVSPGKLFWIPLLITAAFFLLLRLNLPLVTGWIVKRVNDIDLEQPEYNFDYDDIEPLLKRIRERHTRIENQIRELDRARGEFSAIMENMSEGLLVLDGGGRVLSHNKSAARILASPENLDGLNILALSREEKFREAVRLSLEGSPKEKIVELQGRLYQLFVNPVTEGEEVRGAILLLLDVTEKQERDNLRHEFTTNVSHELKTPLTVISGYAEIMAGGMVKNKDIPEFANKIFKEAKRLIVLVNDLMFLSGLEENKLLTKGPADLFTLAKEVARRLAGRAEEANVTLNVTGEPLEVNGLTTVLDEMIFNLIENAVKYNRPGGSVTVDVKKRGGFAALTVADTGIGIPKAERERIFERFYRVDKSHNNSIPGTGLGLSIVKHGAILHDAEIELKSGSKGSSFTLVFPI